MAKVTIFGNAAVITSTMKSEDIKTIQKYHPEALVLKDEDGDEYFRVGVGTRGNVNVYGVTFDGETRDEAKYATLTLAVSPDDGENIIDCIEDEIGNALANLNKVERGAAAVLEQIREERAAVRSCITIVQ